MLNRREFCLATITSAVCVGLHAQTGGARYVGTLDLRALPQGRRMQLLSPFGFVDANGESWQVPEKAILDGASIPPVFWSVIGGPWDGPYRDASVVHDWYCAVRIMPSGKTHRMFYEAMLTSKVESRLARLMYLAVRFAGPSWDDLTIANSRILSGEGKKRLQPLRNVYSSGFSSATETEKARSRVLDRFRALSEEVDAKNLAPADIDELVDRSGRMETLAAGINTTAAAN